MRRGEGRGKGEAGRGREVGRGGERWAEVGRGGERWGEAKCIEINMRKIY